LQLNQIIGIYQSIEHWIRQQYNSSYKIKQE
jgi:hypothetical protein